MQQIGDQRTMETNKRWCSSTIDKNPKAFAIPILKSLILANMIAVRKEI